MRVFTKERLDQLLFDSHTIEKDGHGLKVVRLSNGDFLKLYRRKRWLSSALWSPPAMRFAENAIRLQQLGIAAPNIVEVLQIPTLQINAVQYQPLPGDTLRSHWRKLDESSRNAEVRLFGSFLGLLHMCGVYFRSLHLGNVLLMPDARFGLIDLSDMQISRRPLGSGKRRRNIAHMLRYEEEANWLADRHLEALLAGYSEKCGPAAASHLAKSFSRLYGKNKRSS